ncbi:MAG: hypothetical protein WCF92_02820 [bacterium]
MKIKFIKPIRLIGRLIPVELSRYLDRDLKEVVGVIVPVTGCKNPDSRNSILIKRQDLAQALFELDKNKNCRDLAMALDHPKIQQVDGLNRLRIFRGRYEFVY